MRSRPITVAGSLLRIALAVGLLITSVGVFTSWRLSQAGSSEDAAIAAGGVGFLATGVGAVVSFASLVGLWLSRRGPW
jgi:hypothetical protein